jgi:hypothetical protein
MLQDLPVASPVFSDRRKKAASLPKRLLDDHLTEHPHTRFALLQFSKHCSGTLA